MKLRLKLLFILKALSICSIVLYGCSITNPAIYKNNQIHIYDFKTEKLIHNLSDSTNVIIYPGPNQDKTILDLFENGILTPKILTDAYQNKFNWYEFDTIQPEIIRSFPDTFSDKIDDKTVVIQYSSSKIDVDGSTLHNFQYFIGSESGLYCFELKQIKQGHFALRFKGFIL